MFLSSGAVWLSAALGWQKRGLQQKAEIFLHCDPSALFRKIDADTVLDDLRRCFGGFIPRKEGFRFFLHNFVYLSALQTVYIYCI